MPLKCVPLNPAWTGDTKLDMRAIYARPNGDLSGSLPLRRHHSWEAKGLRYVTLADSESLALAVPFLRANGLNPQDFVVGTDGDGRPTPWNPEVYQSDNAATRAAEEVKLKSMIDEFGVETVEKITGAKVPEHLKPVAVETKGKR
jgi:hypothetical protein